MKQTIYLLLILFLASCSKQVLNETPLQYSYIPRYLEFDSINVQLPKSPEEMIELDSLEYFKQFPLDSGQKAIKNGILISERTAGEFIFYKSSHERISKELEMSEYLRKDFYEKSKQAEKLYQQYIIELRKQNKRTWLEKNIGFIGFAAGLATAILTEFAVLSTRD